MREIKFRAWDKETVQLRRVSQMDFPEWSVSTVELNMNDEIHEYYSTERNSFKNESSDRFLLMQYTGLKDKNGVEIYEGDIVTNGQPQNDHVVSGTHVVKLENAGFYPFSIAGWEGTMSISECEIIGNIYENPELLNNKDNKDIR